MAKQKSYKFWCPHGEFTLLTKVIIFFLKFKFINLLVQEKKFHWYLMFSWLEATFFKQCSFVDCQISFFHALLGLVRYCAEEIQDHIRQNLAGFSQDSLFELGKVFCLPSAVIIFLLDCSPKDFYGAEGGYGRWIAVSGDISDSLVFEKMLGCISILSRRQIRPDVVENNCCAFPGWMEWLACRDS